MAEVLGLGVSHSPTFARPAQQMSTRLRKRLEDPDLPAQAKDPALWPALARSEWSDDHGAQAGAAHHAAMLVGFRKAREALDAFRPDLIVIWGDDQYENFKEDIIPPFCVMAYDEIVTRPWRPHGSETRGRSNVWNEPPEQAFATRCHREAALYLVERLLQSNVDMAYAYRPLHHEGLSHAFLNPLLFLDYDREGMDYPVVPFQVNCYGRRVVAERGLTVGISDDTPADPPSPSPSRCFEVGATVARIMAESPWRVALMASSSWSHSFLTKKTYRMWPDVDFDRRLYERMVEGDLTFWRDMPLEVLEDAGGHETLNWFMLMGAMNALGRRCVWSDFIETYLFNATKVTAIFDVAG